MNLPDGLRRSVESVLAEQSGRETRIADSTPVAGGCISPVSRLRTDRGDSFCLKRGSADLPPGMLAAEARGLELLARTGSVRVPAVLGTGGAGDSAWLLTEWLEPGTAGRDAWARLGAELAELHGHGSDRFGADEDNFIGPLAQSNAPTRRWSAFWWESRLEPQLRAAVEAGLLGSEDQALFDRLGQMLEELLAPAGEDGASLLHGDLWSGNVHMMADGTAALIDPSVYHGHREVDLAMADLFGGFGAEFSAAYQAAWPLAPGYAPRRRAVYQLYYLLVHVNLFGVGYLNRTRRALAMATH